MKKLWFSITCFIAALFLPIILIVFACIDIDMFVYGSILVSSFSTSLILVIIGVANQPRKENKHDN